MLEFEFFRNALLGGMLIAFTCGILGVPLILRRMSFFGEGIAHIAFGAVAVAMFLNLDPVLFASLFAVMSVLLIKYLKKRYIYAETSLAILFVTGVAIGILFISVNKGFNTDTMAFIVGNLLALKKNDLIFAFLAFVISIVFMMKYHRELLLMSISEELAKFHKINTEKVDIFYLLIVALVTVFVLKATGLLLVSAFFILPATIALLVSNGYKKAILLAGITGCASLLLGTYASYFLNLPVGSVIVLILVLIFLIVSILKRH